VTKLLIHSTGTGMCSLTGKETDGLTVTFDDGTVKEAFLSWRGFKQLLGLKSGQKLEPKPVVAVPVPPTAPKA
jgi:hypothetical protein